MTFLISCLPIHWRFRPRLASGKRDSRPAMVGIGAALLLTASWAAAEEPAQPIETIQVTATRAETSVMNTPASISIIDGDTLRARNATDLRTALAGLAGVEISPGSDSGPAASVPAMLGLREFDAFLLVVDGVPWGGAFNPALAMLDLHNVERIEVLRGPAPVMYGATSFVGVINVIHYPAGESDGLFTLSAGGVPGKPGNVSAAASTALPDIGQWSHSLSADLARERYADEKAGFERGHALYRAATAVADGTFRLDVDLNVLRQSPLSPYPRVGNGLDPAIDTDANFHPADAAIDETRAHVTAGYVRSTAIGEWITTLALSHNDSDVVRGFLSDACGPVVPDPATNACGHRQDRRISDVYFDSHLIARMSDRLTAVVGIDDLIGKGTQEATIFDYSVDPVHGNDAPSSSTRPALENNELEVERNFAGAYGQLDWQPAEPIHVIAGLRLNSTHEVREGEEDLPSGPAPSRQSRSDTELSGSIGLTWLAWASEADAISLFADYRDTFKPAAVDFGPEAESDILDPESAHVAELGVRTRWLGGRLDLDITGFDMTMKNLVVPQNVDGSPGLTNAGVLHLKGAEAEINWHLAANTQLHVGYAHHTSRFGDYERLFDGVPTQLAGNSQELSPRDTGSIGVLFAAPEGLILSADYTYTGERFLNKRNTSLASSFGLLDASVGYRFESWELRLDGRNLTDARDPVSESELGDGQYYRMPSRTISLTVVAHM